MKFEIGDKVVYHATEQYRTTGLTQFEGVEGIIVSSAIYNDCYRVLFDGEDEPWQPAGENLQLIRSKIVWEV